MDKVQRLILINQYKILEKLQEGEKHPTNEFRLAISALQHGFGPDIQEIIDEAVWDGLSDQECREVRDVLDMYRRIRNSLDHLPEKEADEIRALPWMTFDGFDGNNESAQHSYASFLLKEAGRWTESLKSEHHPLNTHHPTLSAYRSMLDKLEEFGRDPYFLTAKQLRELSES